ncbi:hypothetical protein [Quadrisphaera sp. DSM 44207]|uniref:hypothetical protein n=1 Tax=Quadrisphaera sp. DSM 44207 TaxID=1881057 RepID=UPI00088B3D00|nr:hypothetical protein [Quadrisphaera sp. DSM 44207]SDQ04310.1 hypothetical protein SAMN05428996_0111 [Quadrisphaera sp. DSM 44207]
MADQRERVLVVDVANVVGSRPDGWWRDRAGAAQRLLAGLRTLPGAGVAGPDGDPGALVLVEVVAVLEGAARSADPAAHPGLRVVRAQRDGDAAVVAEAGRVVDAGAVPLVVTADRGLRERLPAGSRTTGPGWLNALLGR